MKSNLNPESYRMKQINRLYGIEDSTSPRVLNVMPSPNKKLIHIPSKELEIVKGSDSVELPHNPLIAMEDQV